MMLSFVFGQPLITALPVFARSPIVLRPTRIVVVGIFCDPLELKPSISIVQLKHILIFYINVLNFNLWMLQFLWFIFVFVGCCS